MLKILREFRAKRQRSQDMMEEVAAAREAEKHLRQSADEGKPPGEAFTSDDLRRRAAELRDQSSVAQLAGDVARR